MSYATLVQLREYLKISANIDDILLQRQLDHATAIIERMTHKAFAVSADTVKLFDAVRDVHGMLLTFDGDYAAAITSVINGDGETIPASGYVTEPRHEPPYYGVKLKLGGPYVWEFNDTPEEAISVTGRWGWSVTPPDDIVHACTRLAAWMYRQKDTSGDSDRVLISRDGTVVLPMKLPADIHDLLSPYVPLID